MVNDDWMVARRLIQIVPRQRAIELRVVEHETRHPQPGRARLRLLVDGFEQLRHRADVAVDAVELVDTARVRMRVDESRDDRHLLGIDDRRPRRCKIPDVARRSDRDESAVFYGECLGARLRRLDGVHVRVDDDEIGSAPGGGLLGLRRHSRIASDRERARERRTEPEELTARVLGHANPWNHTGGGL